MSQSSSSGHPIFIRLRSGRYVPMPPAFSATQPANTESQQSPEEGRSEATSAINTFSQKGQDRAQGGTTTRFTMIYHPSQETAENMREARVLGSASSRAQGFTGPPSIRYFERLNISAPEVSLLTDPFLRSSYREPYQHLRPDGAVPWVYRPRPPGPGVCF